MISRDYLSVKFGTCIWSRNQLRLSPSTSTSAPSSAASMKTTASLTSLSAAGMELTRRSCLAATGEHHCGCCHKQPLPLPGELLVTENCFPPAFIQRRDSGLALRNSVFCPSVVTYSFATLPP